MRLRKILIFDDVEIFLRLERTFLNREEFQLITANSGKDTLELCRKYKPDLIFLDLFLPDMGGDECCQLLKRDEKQSVVPVIMVADSGRESDLERCQSAGCDAVLTRPINRKMFIDTVRKFLTVRERLPPRYSIRMPVNYWTGHDEFFTGCTVNLNIGGMFVETDQPSAINTTLAVELFDPHDSRRMKCNALVTWVNQPEMIQNQGLPAGMGLRFLDLHPTDLEVLQEFVSRSKGGQYKNDDLPGDCSRKDAEGRVKILLIDKNLADRNKLKSILVSNLYLVIEAGTCEKAFELAVAQVPDLIIMGETLQAGTEYDFTALLRQNHKTCQIPVILCSGLTDAPGENRDSEVGATEYINWPLREREVLARVRNCLGIHQLSRSLSNARRQLMAKDRERDENMRAASIIQHSLLPLTMPKVVTFDFAWRFMPCEQVGGDLFNIFKLDERYLEAYIMDVSGKGMAAAMMATLVSQSLNPSSSQFLKAITNSPPYYEIVPPSLVLARLNREYPIERFEKYLTICYLLLDIQTGELCYSNAAHPSPLLLRADGRIERLNEGGTIIGIGEDVVYAEGKVQMKAGDRLFLYTDGIVEHSGHDGELYGEFRLVSELQATLKETLQMTCASIMNSVMKFGGGLKPEDDITFLGIEYR